jgi:hypothetical protein
MNRTRNFRPLIEFIAWTLLGLWFLSLSTFGSSLPSRASVQNPALPVPRSTFGQLPAAEPSQIGTWLVSACAVLSAAALARQFKRKTPIEAEFLTKKEFQEFKDKEFADLRNRVDQSFRSLSDKLDGINERLHDVRSLVDRLDERSKHLPPAHQIQNRK